MKGKNRREIEVNTRIQDVWQTIKRETNGWRDETRETNT